MKILQLWLKQIKNLGLILMMGVSMHAYSATMSWKEEVVLHDGKIIVAERFYNLGGYPAIESHNRTPLDETITFVLPESNKQISWRTEYRNELSESSSLGALLLDVVDGVPYIATSPTGCIAYNKWGRPNPPYVLFKYVNDEWKRIPLEEFPPVLVHANMMSRPDSRGLKSYYTVEQVKEQMRGRNIAETAKTILREPVANTAGDGITSCLELVLYKGKWIMPNDPVMRAILDRKSK
ncbi:MAG: hypothetical protein WC736_05475 [Gallionella sp.]|jgi:hypothetical protein